MDGYALPPPSKYARNVDPERDATILRMADAGATLAEIGRAVGLAPGSVEKRLCTLRERLADAAEAEERARRYPGWPRDAECLSCRKVERREHPGERVCNACKQTVAWRAGDGARGAVTGIRRGRG